MLIKCPKCGILVSDKAIKCPKCGKVLLREKSAPVGYEGILSDTYNTAEAGVEHTKEESTIVLETPLSDNRNDESSPSIDQNKKPLNPWYILLPVGVLLIAFICVIIVRDREDYKNENGIKPEDIIHYDPHAIGKSVYEKDGEVFVDLEGYGNSDSTDELKAFQKYGYLEFNGKMRFMMEPNFLYGYTFGDYDWRIVLNVHPNLVQTTGIVEFLWGWVELMEAKTQAFMYFGTRADDFTKYFDDCLKKNNNDSDPEINKIAKLLMSQEDSEPLGIRADLFLIRKSDGKVGICNTII